MAHRGLIRIQFVVFIFLIFFLNAKAAAQSDNDDFMVGVRLDMLQVPRNYSGVSPESQWSRGIWTMHDAKSILSRYHRGELDETARILTIRRQSEINFSDHLFARVWQPHWAETQIYPLFQDSGIRDRAPDLGYRHDPSDRRNENDFVFFATGYILVPEEGQYDIGVLNDDGFLFQLDLINEKKFILTDSHLSPLHPPRFFSKTVYLRQGLYPFSLLSFEHLEASVIRLSWKKPSAKKYEVIPSEYFRVMRAEH